ncbi:OmpA family protein [Reichenbachiella sp.]|uniref:OmpA family protein n=1 Tax=Reichenbachiella sp. TaxID=2184521 RepID=UPI003B5B6463
MRILFTLCSLLLSYGLTIHESYAQESTPTTTIDSLEYYKSTSKIVGNINSEATEYAPSISADGKVMIFESNQSGPYKLYEALLDEERHWGKPIPVDSVNNYGNDNDLIGGPNISFDGNTMYFFSSFSGGVGADDIYYSTREEFGWSSPINIGEPINTPGFDGFPSISSNGKTLYFVRVNDAGPQDEELREQTEGQTCYSIYKSEKNKDGEWSTPSKLPYPINKDCEKAPRIMADNRTLIFSSNRPGGLGKYDLYQSFLDDAGDWTTPVPLAYVNSDLNDQFPCIAAQGDKMYYINNNDIYEVDIPPSYQQFRNNVIQGYVENGQTNEGLATEIIVRDAFTSEELMFLNSNAKDGKFSLVLAVGGSYNVEFRREGFTTYATQYDLTAIDEYREIDYNVKLYESAKLNLNIYDVEIFEPILASVKVKIEGERSMLMDLESDPLSGQLELELPLGSVYEVIIDKENFQSEYFVFDASGLMMYPSFEKDIELIPKKKELAINVADLTNNSKVRSRVRIRNRNRDETIIVEGNETVGLRVGDRYEIEATSDQGYAYSTTVLDVTEDGIVNSEGEAEITAAIDMKLQPLLVGANLTLKDILFESNSDQLSENSYDELLRVVGLMYANPTMAVEISAHTDDVGSASYNQLLSKRRAKSVVEFLQENEIEGERFTPVGYGEAQPLVANDTDEGRAKNRRVVLKILKI